MTKAGELVGGVALDCLFPEFVGIECIYRAQVRSVWRGGQAATANRRRRKPNKTKTDDFIWHRRTS